MIAGATGGSLGDVVKLSTYGLFSEYFLFPSPRIEVS